MTRHKHVHREIIHAWADGADIQYLRLDGVWDDISFPPLNESNEYRIKPRTVKREGWIVIGKNSLGERFVRTDLFSTLAEALSAFPAETPCIIEWEEEE